MRTRIAKWGHSLAVRIPRAYAAQVGVAEGSEVDLIASDGTLVLRRPRYDLKDLLAGITLKNRHDEIATGERRGREAW